MSSENKLRRQNIGRGLSTYTFVLDFRSLRDLLQGRSQLKILFQAQLLQYHVTINLLGEDAEKQRLQCKRCAVGQRRQK